MAIIYLFYYVAAVSGCAIVVYVHSGRLTSPADTDRVLMYTNIVPVGCMYVYMYTDMHTVAAFPLTSRGLAQRSA